MIGWLSDWLRDIIAVILLAVLVELLLPNKAMQRYARLVIGLFILLTILSPILKLLQEDMSDKLDAGMEIWNEQSMKRDIKMPGLEEIERRAIEIREQRNENAVKMTEAALEEAMLEEIRLATGTGVERVKVKLIWNRRGKEEKAPEIGSVFVTLKAQGEPALGDNEQSSKVKAVAPVDVHVTVEASSTIVDIEEKAVDGFVSPRQSDSIAIVDVLFKGWGVREKQIMIRQRADGAVGR